MDSTPSSDPDAFDCQSCGACCAVYRVEFPVYELEGAGGTVPPDRTEVVNGNTCRMKGTGAVPIRCTALTGTVGVSVNCGIYPLRPSPCRVLDAGSPGCRKARAHWALAT